MENSFLLKDRIRNALNKYELYILSELIDNYKFDFTIKSKVQSVINSLKQESKKTVLN